VGLTCGKNDRLSSKGGFSCTGDAAARSIEKARRLARRRRIVGNDRSRVIMLRRTLHEQSEVGEGVEAILYGWMDAYGSIRWEGPDMYTREGSR